MLVKTYGAAVQGIDAIPVTIEVLVKNGSLFSMVGLPDTAVKESYQRVQSAIMQSGMEYPRRNIVINLSPADVRKEGSAYDLPMAVGILAGDGILPSAGLSGCMIMGELSLDGSVLPIKGALPMAILARKMGLKSMIVPMANASEAAVVDSLDVYGVDNLSQVASLVSGNSDLCPTIVDTRREFAMGAGTFELDFADVKGQENVKRAFEVACAGGHNILLVGAPGSGKSMMAKRLPSIMPPLTLHEALESTKIHSVAGKLRRGSMLMTSRPFRSPHHTISPVALVGGGSTPMPGEISLAHNGILFLDEFPEFQRSVLEVLRQPLEDRHITVSRAKYTVDYPAGFMLVASMNPCPCGFYNHPSKPCTCMPGAVSRYLNRISGPLLDRIDIQVEIMPVPFEELSSMHAGEPSSSIRTRVAAARAVQASRFGDEPEIHCNAQMTPRLMRLHCALGKESSDLLHNAMTRFDMSARAYDRILKVARTIADLEAAANLPASVACGQIDTVDGKEALQAAVNTPVLSHHIAEAVSYRNLDRASWGNFTAPQKLPLQ